tara:strand:- start:2251 stop:3048 length:798 start_codon:yes stop_codon:yes gene_type:complete
MTFFEQLSNRIKSIDSILCIGLDPNPLNLPDHLQDDDLPSWSFNRRIIDATHSYAAAYKPNAAYYETPNGWISLIETIAYAHGKGVPVILDAKRADIGNTAHQYAKILDIVDAITVNPYMGLDSLSPFLSRSDTGVFILCRTSNPGGSDLQNLQLSNGSPLYEHVARLAHSWNEQKNIGLVVGATNPSELKKVREIAPDLPFLVPGIGAQNGDVESAAKYCLSSNKIGLVNSSRSIIFAGSGDTFDKAAGDAAKRARNMLNQFLK